MKRLLLLSVFLAALCPVSSRAAVAYVSSAQGSCTSTAVTGNIGTTCSSVATKTFTYTAPATNDVIYFHIGCAATSPAPTISLGATGWVITPLTSPVGAAAAWVASFGAVAPNTSAATFTITASKNCGATVTTFFNDLIDAYSGADTTGGTTTFDSHNGGTGTGNTSITCTPANNNDALVGASNDSITAVGSGFTKGADDTLMDWSEHKVLSGGSGVAQTVNFTGSGTWAATCATIKPAATGTVTPERLPLLGVGP